MLESQMNNFFKKNQSRIRMLPVDEMGQNNEFLQFRGRNFSGLIGGSNQTPEKISQDGQNDL